MKSIRNFAIIAHVDHGKSTLADRLLELTGVVEKGKHAEQMLDRNPISRQRGITIKLAPVRMEYDGVVLNLIDTPGHVDFSYEVERTLACVEGVVLLVDATKGIQAQTVAHTYKALDQNLTIIPAINKIDAPHADVQRTKKEVSQFLGVDENTIFEISAKTGQGVEELFMNVIQTVRPPYYTPEVLEGATPEVLEGGRALIFDSHYDTHRGVIAFVRVFDGSLEVGRDLRFIASKKAFVADEVGIFDPNLKKCNILQAGEIGYIVSNLKNIRDVRVGDTIAEDTGSKPLAGYREAKPMVYTSLFATDTDDFGKLKDALGKLALNDASLTYSQISSRAFGGGFRVGFLGLLHAEVVRERLEMEYDLDIVLTSPTVEFKHTSDGGKDVYQEPVADVVIVTPSEYLNPVMRKAEEARGILKSMDNQTHVQLHYEIPLSELVTHLFEDLKSVSSGYASYDWHFLKFAPVQAGRLQLLINADPIEEFSEYVVQEQAFKKARTLVKSLKEHIPRQQFEVKIQAQFGGRIIASERLSAIRKDVTSKLYGGDRTRKDKLLKKQKAGKKRMKMIGRVQVPKEAFVKMFRQ